MWILPTWPYLSLTAFRVGINCSGGPARRSAFPNNKCHLHWLEKLKKSYQIMAVEMVPRGSKDFSFDQNKFRRQQIERRRSRKELCHRTNYSLATLMKISSCFNYDCNCLLVQVRACTSCSEILKLQFIYVLQFSLYSKVQQIKIKDGEFFNL